MRRQNEYINRYRVARYHADPEWRARDLERQADYHIRRPALLLAKRSLRERRRRALIRMAARNAR